MFLVFYSSLLRLLGMFCFNCKAESPKVQVKRNGSMAIVQQTCSKCIKDNFTWKSQPLVLGKYPAGNIMTSFGILMSGINISQAMLMFRHMNLQSWSKVLGTPYTTIYTNKYSNKRTCKHKQFSQQQRHPPSEDAGNIKIQ